MKINYVTLADDAEAAIDNLTTAGEAASMHDWLTMPGNYQSQVDWRKWATAMEFMRLEKLACEAQDEARQTAREWAA